uniref:Uncharacterized protein n=1 Tax=Octopus bimaculoides TaxID=37653 RepID=A0A0L8G0J8_OCTBM
MKEETAIPEERDSERKLCELYNELFVELKFN